MQMVPWQQVKYSPCIGKTKSILFWTKVKSRKAGDLNITNLEIVITQKS